GSPSSNEGPRPTRCTTRRRTPAVSSTSPGRESRAAHRFPRGRLVRPGSRRELTLGLLLKGGDVLDPGAGLSGRLDVRVRDGLLAEVGPGLAAAGDAVLEAAGD